MTDIVWGPAIEVNNCKPDWLRDDDKIQWAVHASPDDYAHTAHISFDEDDWAVIIGIRLPATHAYYLAASRGFTYWPGGDSPPADWDGGKILVRCGQVRPAFHDSWTNDEKNYDAIGYRKRTEQPAIAPELVERMVALVRNAAQGAMVQQWAKNLLADIEPDPDLTLAKSIMGDAGAIALAIKAARENGRG